MSNKRKPIKSDVKQVVRTSDGRTFKVAPHKAKAFLAHMEDRKSGVERKQRSLTRNQWNHNPYGER